MADPVNWIIFLFFIAIVVCLGDPDILDVFVAYLDQNITDGQVTQCSDVIRLKIGVEND